MSNEVPAVIGVIAVEAAREAFVALAKYLQSQGKDPLAELNAALDLADVSVNAAERAKFGP